AHATIARGWALMEQERTEEVIQQIRQGIANHQATGTEVMRAHYLALLAEALAKNKQAEEGLRLLQVAQERVHQNGEGYYEAELYRLKGELLLLQSTDQVACGATTERKAMAEARPLVVVQAEDCFHQAIRIAQRQQAKSLEL